MIDYPNDLGCSSPTDNIELDSDSLTGGPSGNESVNKTGVAEKIFNKSGLKSRFLFWSILIILVTGVIFLAIQLLRHFSVYIRFAKSINPSAKQLQ